MGAPLSSVAVMIYDAGGWPAAKANRFRYGEVPKLQRSVRSTFLRCLGSSLMYALTTLYKEIFIWVLNNFYLLALFLRCTFHDIGAKYYVISFAVWELKNALRRLSCFGGWSSGLSLFCGGFVS